MPGLGPAGRSLCAVGRLGRASAGRGECQAGRPGWSRSSGGGLGGRVPGGASAKRDIGLGLGAAGAWVTGWAGA